MNQKGEPVKQRRVWYAQFTEEMRDAMIVLWQHGRATAEGGETLDNAVATLKPFIPKEAGGDWEEPEEMPVIPVFVPPGSQEVQ
jgi:hypothetical protein